jgi:hypothetical protein
MGGEDFARSNVTDQLQAPISKIWISQFDSGNICIGLASDWSKHPIISACICKNQCWTQLGGGQVLNWKRDQNYLAARKCAYATSSSLRDQSSDKAISLRTPPKSAVSAEASEGKVTQTRCAI